MSQVERELRKTAVVVAVTSVVGTTCAVFLLYRWARHTFKRRAPATHQNLPRWSWLTLVPTILLFLVQHILSGVAGFTDILRGSPLVYYGANEDFHLPATLTQQLFLVLQLVTIRVAFWEILLARRKRIFKASRHAGLVVLAFDLLLGIALVAAVGVSAVLGSPYGLCGEGSCGNATQLSLIGVNNIAISVLVLASTVSLVVSYFFFAKWTPLTPGVHLSSPLARSVLRIVGPGLVAQFFSIIIIIAVSHSTYDYWRTYYAFIPFLICQVVLLGLTIHVLKATPVFADPDSLVDRNSNPLVVPNARSSLRNITPERYSVASADSPTGGPRFPPGLEPVGSPYAVEVALDDSECEMDDGGASRAYQVYRGNEKTALDTIAEDEYEETDDYPADGRRTARSGTRMTDMRSMNNISP